MSVFIYCRVSTEDQEDNTSLEQQEIDCREYCRINGHHVAGVFTETFTGSLWRERKILMEMRARYLRGDADGVVVRTTSRLTRITAHYYVLTEEMKEHNVRLLCVKEQYEDSATGRTIQGLQMGFNEMERETTRQRTIDGKRARVVNKKAYLASVKPPYGYDFNDWIAKSKLVINEKEAETVRWILEQRAANVTLTTIAFALNKRNVPSPCGKRWSRIAVKRVIDNGKYLYRGIAVAFKGRDTHEYRDGKRVHVRVLNKDEDLLFLPEGTAPRIISDAVAFQALEAGEINKQDNRHANANPKAALLRGGFVRCGVCGHSMMAININGRRYPYYQCGGIKRPEGGCSVSNSISAGILDGEVWNYALKVARELNHFEQAIHKILGMDTLASAENSTTLCINECDLLIEQYKQDLKKKDWKAATRQVLLEEMENQLEKKADLEAELEKIKAGRLDYNRLKEEFQVVADWCQQVKAGDDEPLTWEEKRSRLRVLGIQAHIFPDCDKVHGRFEFRVSPKGLLDVLNGQLSNEHGNRS